MWQVFRMFSPWISFYLLGLASEFELFDMQFPWHCWHACNQMYIAEILQMLTIYSMWSNDYIPPLALPFRKDFPTRPQSVQTDLHFLQHFHQRGEVPRVWTAGPSVSGKGMKGRQWWLEWASFSCRLFPAHNKRDEPHLSSRPSPFNLWTILAYCKWSINWALKGLGLRG